MNKKQAVEIAHTLSNPSKMPCKGYSLPASACKTGSKLRQQPGTVCSDCYACKGMYRFKNVQTALQSRLEAISHPDWVDAMVTLIGSDEYFRWHDSGDIQSTDHLLKIIAVCNMTPSTKHWLPTKERSMVTEVANMVKLPSNLTIRISAPLVNSKALTNKRGLLSSRSIKAGMVVEATTHICPAPKQDGKCEDCRACWDRNIEDVAYLMH